MKNTVKTATKSRFKPTRILLIAFGALCALALGVFLFFYFHYSSLIDERLTGKRTQGESRIYTAPRRILVGETVDPGELVSYLQAAGYTEKESAESVGRIALAENALEIHPSLNSYFAG
jgi:hypothetical protein